MRLSPGFSASGAAPRSRSGTPPRIVGRAPARTGRMLMVQTPPSPVDAWETQRWEATRRRRRMLTGQWRADLMIALQNELGQERSEEIGSVDLSSNVFASVCSTLAVSYDVAPLATHADPAAALLMNALLDGAGYAPTMQEVQRL